MRQVQLAELRRSSGSSTATTRQPWRLPPLGAKRAASSARSSISRGTGSSVKRRLVGAQRIASCRSIGAGRYPYSTCRSTLAGAPGGDREGVDVARDDAVGADHAALADA